MKYLIRLLATIPVIGTGCGCVELFFLSFEEAQFAPLTAGCFLGFLYLIYSFDGICDTVSDIFDTLTQ